MKLRVSVAAACVAAGCLLLQASADDKKDKEQAKEVVVNGELVNADLKDRVRTQCFCKTYTFKMIEGKIYQIDMRSKVLDSFLRLEDPNGQQVSEDDDSGGNLDARIVYQAVMTGDYQIIATSFDQALGKFTLAVKEKTK
jgi:hypothetical protein